MENSSIVRDNEVSVLTEVVEELERKIDNFRLSGERVSGSIRTGGFIIRPGNTKAGLKESLSVITITPPSGTVVTVFAFVLTVSGDGDTIPTGTVSLLPIPVTFDLIGGQVIFASVLAIGEYAFSFNYSGDQNYLPSISNVQVVVVTLATASASIDVFPNPAGTDEPVTFATTVTGQSGVVPTGTVTLFPWGSIHPLTNGSFTETLLVVEGTYNVQFHYNGDSNYLPADSDVVVLEVHPTSLLTPTITLSTEPGQPIPPLQPFSVTARVSGTGGVPTGQVSGMFDDFALPLQNLNASGETTWDITFEYVGTYLVQLNYHGDTVYNPNTHNENVEVGYGAGASTPDFPGAVAVSGDAMPDYQYNFKILFGATPPNGQVQIGLFNPAFSMVNCAGGEFFDSTQMIIAGGSPVVAGVYVWNPTSYSFYTFNVPSNNELDLTFITQGTVVYFELDSCSAVAALQLTLLDINNAQILINGQQFLTTLAVLSPPWGG